MRINYTRLATLLLPTFLRQNAMLATMRVWMRPMQQLHDQHTVQRQERMYSIAHTGQACHIKDMLNKFFKVGNYADNPDYESGFQIQDIDAVGTWLMVYDETADEAINNILLKDEDDNPNTMVYDESVIVNTTCAFLLIVPRNIDLNTCRNQIERLLNQYRLASRTAYINQ